MLSWSARAALAATGVAAVAAKERSLTKHRLIRLEPAQYTILMGTASDVSLWALQTSNWLLLAAMTLGQQTCACSQTPAAGRVAIETERCGRLCSGAPATVPQICNPMLSYLVSCLLQMFVLMPFNLPWAAASRKLLGMAIYMCYNLRKSFGWSKYSERNTT